MDAQTAFVQSLTECKVLLDALRERLDNHLGTHPESVNWGDVGDANYIQEQLRRLVDEEFVEGEL